MFTLPKLVKLLCPIGAAVFISLLISSAPCAHAATVNILEFNAINETTDPPLVMTIQKLYYEYEATWSAPQSDRIGYRRTWWYENDAEHHTISSEHHYTTPVSASGTHQVAVQSPGAGRYYKMKVDVRDAVDFNIVYATTSSTDGNFAN